MLFSYNLSLVSLIYRAPVNPLGLLVNLSGEREEIFFPSLYLSGNS